MRRLAASASSLLTLAVAFGGCMRASAQLTLSSNLVQVGVVVSDSKGPVRGLKAENFVVLDQGRPRKVSVLLEQSGGMPQPAALAKNSFSNAATARSDSAQAQTNGTPTIILLDSLNSLYGSRPVSAYEETPTWTEDMALVNAKQRLIAALKEMDLRNPVAAYGLGATLKMLCDFTCSREQLLDAVKRYDPSDKTSREVAQPGIITIPGQEAFSEAINIANRRQAGASNAGRGNETMAALQAIVARVSTIPGRKNLLWLTSSLPFSGDAIARIVTPAKIAIYPVDGRGLLTWAFGAMPQDVPGAGASLANTSRPVGIEAMQEMADDTGGIAFVNTNDIAGAVRSVIEDRSVTYTLGFYVDAGSIDGKFHNLKIRVNAPNATLRYARGYFALKSQTVWKQAALQKAVADAADGPALLAAAVNSPFAASAVPLEVKVERDAENKLRLEGRIGIQGLSLRQNATGRHGMIVVYMVEQDAAGNVLTRGVHQMQLNLTDQQFDEYARSGVLFTEAVEPQARATTFRVIVRDGVSSRMGSVIIPLAQVR